VVSLADPHRARRGQRAGVPVRVARVLRLRAAVHPEADLRRPILFSGVLRRPGTSDSKGNEEAMAISVDRAVEAWPRWWSRLHKLAWLRPYNRGWFVYNVCWAGLVAFMAGKAFAEGRFVASALLAGSWVAALWTCSSSHRIGVRQALTEERLRGRTPGEAWPPMQMKPPPPPPPPPPRYPHPTVRGVP
jgi:hypothetical protein